MTHQLESILKQVQTLTWQERTERIAQLALPTRQTPPQGQTRRRWSDIRGMAKGPLHGEDAQRWVTRTRQDHDLEM